MFQAPPNKILEDNMTTTKKLRNKCFILSEALSVKVYIYVCVCECVCVSECVCECECV